MRLDRTIWIKDPAEKAAARKVIMEEAIPKYLGGLERLVCAEKAGCAVGEGVSIADVAMYAHMRMIKFETLCASPNSLRSCLVDGISDDASW